MVVRGGRMIHAVDGDMLRGVNRVQLVWLMCVLLFVKCRCYEGVHRSCECIGDGLLWMWVIWV